MGEVSPLNEALIGVTLERLGRLHSPEACTAWLADIGRLLKLDVPLLVHTSGDEHEPIWLDRRLPPLYPRRDISTSKHLPLFVAALRAFIGGAREQLCNSVVLRVSEAADYETALTAAVEGACSISGSIASIGWRLDAGEMLHDVATAGTARNARVGMALGRGFAGTCAKRGTSLSTADIQTAKTTDGRTVEPLHAATVRERRWRAGHFEPIVTPTGVKGVLAMYSDIAYPYGAQSIRRLRAIVGSLAVKLAADEQEREMAKLRKELADAELAKDYYRAKLRDVHDIGKRLMLLAPHVLLLRSPRPMVTDIEGEPGRSPNQAQFQDHTKGPQQVHESLERLSRELQYAVKANMPASVTAGAAADSRKRRKVILGPLLTSVYEDFQDKLGDARIDIKAIGLNQNVAILANPSHIRDCANNLLDNALYFARQSSKPGRRVITLALHTDGDSVHISVADDGPGIAPDVMDIVFEAGVSTKGEDGAGLGLASAKHLVELYGGMLRHESRFGFGASFTMSFPASPA